MIRLFPHPRPPLQLASFLSLSVFLCVAYQAYWRKRGQGVGEEQNTATIGLKAVCQRHPLYIGWRSWNQKSFLDCIIRGSARLPARNVLHDRFSPDRFRIRYVSGRYLMSVNCPALSRIWRSVYSWSRVWHSNQRASKPVVSLSLGRLLYKTLISPWTIPLKLVFYLVFPRYVLDFILEALNTLIIAWGEVFFNYPSKLWQF